MNAFCTIVDEHYIPFAKAVYASIEQYDIKKQFFVLICSFDNKPEQEDDTKIRWINLADIMESALAKKIIRKYLHQNKKNELRWALKPVLIAWLLSKGLGKIIYTDCDIFFVNNPDFLFGELNKHSVILTPHWENIDLGKDGRLANILSTGYFNAGFIGVSQNGLHVMNWWAEACSYKMEKSSKAGLYDDQRYLDILPFEFEKVNILQHRGCNLACWNMHVNKREIIDGKLKIAKEYEPVFIHFTNETIQNIINGNDKLLFPYLQKYITILRNFLSPGDTFLTGTGVYNRISFIVSLKHKLLIRTRIKKMMYKIAEKL